MPQGTFPNSTSSSQMPILTTTVSCLNGTFSTSENHLSQTNPILLDHCLMPQETFTNSTSFPEYADLGRSLTRVSGQLTCSESQELLFSSTNANAAFPIFLANCFI
ncbi:unnamed protein product [Caenorhabditis angaria]|uniref:Uncharacterized protein n=1 Tax=Caenorhabditis angaria TaxID=860376 RepID=A0A9P1I4P0_9PELO|nr:unnamed protein product [Caenorhabditis angaria]